MNIRKHIPNFITLLNLVCGVLAILLFLKSSFSDSNINLTAFYELSKTNNSDSFESYYTNFIYSNNIFLGYGLIFILLASVFDFLDGFAARLLNVKSEIGAQLDSLADMVTFGVAPGFLFYALATLYYPGLEWLKYLFIIIPVFSAIRLAKFNVDTEQTTYFKGLATPANAIFWVGIAFVMINHITIPFYLLAALIIIMSLLMVSNFKMFSLKVSNLKFEGDNIYRISLIGLTLVTLVVCSLLANIFFAIPIIIILYILLSIPYHLNHNKNN